MAPRSFRFVHVLLALAVGALVGVSLHTLGILDDLFTPKGIRAIVVGPKPDQLNYPKVGISKRAADIVVWVAKTNTDKLRIEFEQEIFDGMVKLPNGRFAVQPVGTSRICISGDIKTDVPEITDGYKYWQILIDAHGTEHPADGRIIINK